MDWFTERDSTPGCSPKECTYTTQSQQFKRQAIPNAGPQISLPHIFMFVTSCLESRSRFYFFSHECFFGHLNRAPEIDRISSTLKRLLHTKVQFPCPVSLRFAVHQGLQSLTALWKHIQGDLLEFFAQLLRFFNNHHMFETRPIRCIPRYSNGKSPFFMGKSTISMAIYHCYVSSPEGKW